MVRLRKLAIRSVYAGLRSNPPGRDWQPGASFDTPLLVNGRDGLAVPHVAEVPFLPAVGKQPWAKHGRTFPALITLDKADEPALLKAWEADALFMKRQPSFISTQLHRAIGDSVTYLNYAVWEPTAASAAAFSHPEFVSKLSAYPSSVVATPHLFQKVSVPNVCVA